MIQLIICIAVLVDNPLLQEAESLFVQERYASADSLYNIVLQTGSGSDRAWGFKGLGNIALIYGNLTQAQGFYKQALYLFNDINDDRGQAKVHNNLGQLHALRADPQTAYKHYEKALYFIEKVSPETRDDQLDRIAIVGNTGQALLQMNQLDESFKFFQRALEQAKQISYETGIADNLYNIAVMNQTFGEVDSALVYFTAAYNVYTRLSYDKSQADCLREMGNIYRKIGDYNHAIEYLFKAKTVFQSYYSKTGTLLLGTAEIYNNLGLLMLEFGKLNEAFDYFTQAQQSFEKIGDITGISTTLQNKARVYMEYGINDSTFYDSAWALYSIAEKHSKNPLLRAELLNNQGLYHECKGDFQAADRVFEKAMKILEKTPEANTVKYLNNRGNVTFAQGKYKEALEYYTKAYSDALSMNQRPWEVALLSNLGMVEHKLGHLDHAIKYLVRASYIIEEMRGELVSQEYRSTYFEDKIVIYEELIAIMCEQGRAEPAFDYAERAKARAFLDLIAHVDFSVRHDISPEIRDLINKEQHYSKKIEFLTGDPKQNEAIGQLNLVLAKLEHLFPEYYDLKTITPVTATEIQQSLDSVTALIEYFLGPRRGYVFVITHDRISIHPITPHPREIYQAVDSLVRRIRRRHDHFVYGTWLYDHLLRPIEPEIKAAQRLCIIPHGVLHHLPFATLVTDDEQLLIDQYDIFYAPSASVYSITHDKNRLSKNTTLVFAKSDFSDHRDWFDLPLPGTGAEKDSILSNSGLLSVRVYADAEGPAFQPSESNLKAVAQDYDIIHCATHGKLDSDSPLDSKIVLSRDEEEDGNLTVREIFTMQLSAYMVTLSACETGKLKGFGMKSRYSTGDDLTGLTRAFLYAGASSVVASLWKVHDISTALLMTRYYTNLQNGDKVSALCEAQRWLLHNEELYYFNKPFFWAPFVVFGDWQ